MSLRGRRHLGEIIMRVRKYLDTRVQFAISARAEHRFARCYLKWYCFLGFTRAADELQSCSAQQWEGNHQGQ
eukprot:7984346-Pyramimonas_sp.AAC.1